MSAFDRGFNYSTLLYEGITVKKNLLVIGSTLLSSVGAFAADITYAEATGFGGTFNLTPFYSAITIVVVAIGVVAAVKLALGTFKRV